MTSTSFLRDFIDTVAEAGCEVFVIHARRAVLNGLSPKENREIPPLKYDIVRQLRDDFPTLTFMLNGGIRTLEEVEEHLRQFDGVMLGREAYSNPYLLGRNAPRLRGPKIRFACSGGGHRALCRLIRRRG